MYLGVVSCFNLTIKSVLKKDMESTKNKGLKSFSSGFDG